MYYKGIEVDISRINKPWTINDIPDSELSSYSDVLPKKKWEHKTTYKQRIANYLNIARQKVASGVATLIHNSDKIDLMATNFNANPGQNIFRPKKAQTPAEAFLHPQRNGLVYKFSGPREFTTLDIETDDRGRPITISALKQVFNRNTGQFETVDNYQRFYHARNGDMKESSAVHGLTSAKLKRLRSQQAQNNGNIGYSKSYNASEQASLRAFLGNSVIVGHNIVDFDLPHLFDTPINNQVIDTLTASRNQWRTRKNDLDSVFKRLYGKSMEQAGLSHHDSMSDVIATAMIMQKMAKIKGRTGDSLRYVMTHPGVHIAPEDDYIESQIIKGTYNEYYDRGRYIKMDDEHVRLGDIVNKRMLGGKYNEDTQSYDLPDGMHYEDEALANDYPVNDNFDDSMLIAQSLSEVAKELKREVQRAGAMSQEARDAYLLGNMSRTQQTIRNLSGFDNETAMRSELAVTYGITNKDTQDLWIRRAQNHRTLMQEQRSRNNARSRLEKAKWLAEYEGRSDDLAYLSEIDDTFGPQEIWQMIHDVDEGRKKQAKEIRETEKIDRQNARFNEYKNYEMKHLDRHYDLGDWKKQFKKTTDRYEFDEVLDKMRIEKARDKTMHKLEKSGYLTKGDRALLTAADNMEDFNDAADQVAERMRKVTNSFYAFSKIPSYNFERLEYVFKGEVGGIKGAIKGLVPNTIYSPFSRLTSASMNALTENYAGLKMGVRAGTAIGGGLMGAGTALAVSGVGTIPGLIMMGAGGITSAISQIIGNAQEAKITQWGEGIQNNFNTLGFLKDMILMPFRLLRSAIDGVLKGLKLFAGVLKSLVNIMGTGMGTLSGMGNPITGMTGVGYGDYIGLNSIDAASLLGKGTVNNIMNDFAQQRMKLYTTGQLDTNRLVAASMLGVFDEVYGYRAGDEDAFSEAMNRIHNNMKGMDEMTRKQQFALANTVNSNIAEILQTMDTLGIDDINELKQPHSMWGYNGNSLDGYRRRFQQSQWEYTYGNSQFDITKGRIAASLWNGPAGFSISGRGMTNAFNKVMKSVADALDTGEWTSVGNTIKGVWEMIKSGAVNLWDTIKDVFGISSTKSFGTYLRETVVGWGTRIIDVLKNYILPTVNSVWDQIIDIVIEKFTGLASYLSTVKIDWKEFYKQVIKGEASDKPWITSLGDNVFDIRNQDSKKIYDKFISVSQGYDSKYGVNNLWRMNNGSGRTMAGIPEFEYNKSALQSWLSTTLKTGTPEQINYLNELLEKQLGFNPRLQPGQDGEEFLNYLIQRNIKAAGANRLHGNKWGDIQEDTMNDPLNKGINRVIEEYRTMREPVTSGVIDAVGGTLMSLTGLQIQDPAVLKVQFRDDKGNAFAGAEVKMSGKVDTKVYNGFVDLESRDGVFNFQVSQQMRGSR